MFYAHIVLAKKGPLARIWLAAHWDKKITKAHVFETNIEQSVDGIMQPKVKLALRTSGHLLLGVVRIYSRKAKYLLADCNEAFVKIKMAFRPGMVDLPEEHREAAVNAITLPEVFHDFDTPLPELNDVDIEAQFSINQSRADEITMREDYGTMPINIHDDGFGDMGFDDTPDIVRDRIEENIENKQFQDELFTESICPDPTIDENSIEPVPGTSRSALDSIDAHHPHHIEDDGFGDEPFGQPAAGLFEGDIFADAPLVPEPVIAPGTSRTVDSDDDDDHFDVGAPSPAASSYNSRPTSPIITNTQQLVDGLTSPVVMNERCESVIPPASPHMDVIQNEDALNINMVDEIANTDQTTLLNNEEESFALAPVDASALKGVTKSKRKRKLIVDEVKNISGEEMKSQLANTTDIVTTLDLAPPTKRLMYWKETGGVEKLFALPARDIPARCMFKNYQRHLTSRSLGIEDFSVLGPPDVLALEQNQNQNDRSESPVVGKRGKKRKHVAEVVAPIQQQLEQSIPDQMRDVDLPPPTPVSMEMRDDMCVDVNHTFGNDSLMPPPATPGMINMISPGQLMLGMNTPTMMPPTPGLPMIPMTPGGLSHGGLTPAGLHHGSMTPGSLHHGGMTPAGLHHGEMTPVGLHHGGLTPNGLHHGGLTPGDLHHGGLTPAGLHHGGLTPTDLQHGEDMQSVDLRHGGMTPHHGGMTPHHSGMTPHHGGMTPHHGGMTPHHGGMTPHHGGMTPHHTGMNLHHPGLTPLHSGLTPHAGLTPLDLDHGGLTPHHTSLENIDTIPNLAADQVSSILNGPGMENFSNMGYDGHASPGRAMMSEEIANDWNADYEFPATPTQQGPSEEQLIDETIEQFEERVLNKRAAQMFLSVRARLQKNDTMMLSDMTFKNNKKQAAQKFYSLLMLKKFKALEITQSEPYADIVISRGVMFENPKL